MDIDGEMWVNELDFTYGESDNIIDKKTGEHISLLKPIFVLKDGKKIGVNASKEILLELARRINVHFDNKKLTTWTNATL